MPYVLLFIVELLLLFVLSRRLIKKLSQLLYKLAKSQKITVWILAIIFLPGTFVHEFSHWLTANLLFVHTGNFNLLPKIEEKGVILGSVGIAKTDFVRRTFVGVAPFLFGTSIILGTLYWGKVPPLFSAYIIFEIGNTMFSSRKDLEGTWIFFVFAASITIAFYLLGIQIDIPNEIFEITKEANILLLIPILIDLLLVGMLSVLLH